ncbi:hypothetical protein C6H88_00710 [Chlamydia muridarum str. Nigg]|jgi:hypothetical protein|uniref:Uncharacterized protein n=2 Tax=Chlamydia muridarum TaxID=83560 RepID=A0A069ZQM1_CHLMR|nr:hypothetical protein [Chlamydia muridarum]AAF39012.1 conserved hypothetical protein [Chlamydia muridarum str. Nigg]AHH22526.1 hypothetical protein TAC_00715 [Chlamydia muridarum str. Nigg3 CMUT3-5]AHH23450.1 hypothetical protein Y015_00715 [Chlamydia muridarum str. Nigg CM972]AID37677.1 hypothetical protein BB17_00735 [Chlamydia muridarum str. Nigg 2 MCR]AIT90363.1 hypothetical protein NC80_00690 [Chlamydia muridarum]
MKEKKVLELSPESALLKKLRDRAISQQETQKRKFWIEKLAAMPESTRDYLEIKDAPEPSHLFRKVAERLLKEGA